MLFRQEFKEKIRTGRVTVTFRAWKRPQARVGGEYAIHPIGAIRVEAVSRTRLGEITPAAARRAGFDSLEALRAELARRSGPATSLYRIEFRYLGDRPVEPPAGRDEKLTPTVYRELAARLDRMDARARSTGPWTRAFLASVRDRPATRASDLAADLGWQTDRFKANMRQLKRLGLTHSLKVGYRLSRRGESFLAHEAAPANR